MDLNLPGLLKHALRGVLLGAYAALLTSVALPVSAEPLTKRTLGALQQADKLRINAWVEPREDIIARQQVALQIEIATDTRFSAGTRIGVVEVDGAIVLARENFAINSARNEGARNWTLQQWTLVVYPQRGGVFNVPPIPLHLFIAGDGKQAGSNPGNDGLASGNPASVNQAIIGDIATQAFSFVAKVPEEIKEKGQWFASSRFDIEDSFNKSLDELKPGDALIRNLSMSADNLAAMMLPAFAVDAIEGIGVYPGAPMLNDKVVRGDYRAERSQKITYIIEKPGSYQLPEQRFYWWNLESNTVEVILLEGHTINVGAGSVPVMSNRDAPDSIPPNWSSRLIKGVQYLGLGLVLALMMWFLRRSFRLSKTRLNISVHESEVQLRKRFKAACQNQESELAVSLLYQWLDNYGSQSFMGTIGGTLEKIDQGELMQLFNDVMASIYHPGISGRRDRDMDINRFAKRFVKELNKLERASRSSSSAIDLKLN